MTRLGGQWPAVEQMLAALPPDRQRSVARAAASAALEAVALPVPRTHAEELQAEVQRLDEVAWELQDRDDVVPGEYDAAFRRTRAVAAFQAAQSGDDPAEAIYEALHALGAPADGRFILDL